MISYADRKHKGLKASERLEAITYLMEAGKLVRTGFSEYGNIIPDSNFGVIQKISSGIWGYEGDSLAVYVNGIAYPSVAIVEMNR